MKLSEIARHADRLIRTSQDPFCAIAWGNALAALERGAQSWWRPRALDPVLDAKDVARASAIHPAAPQLLALAADFEAAVALALDELSSTDPDEALMVARERFLQTGADAAIAALDVVSERYAHAVADLVRATSIVTPMERDARILEEQLRVDCQERVCAELEEELRHAAWAEVPSAVARVCAELREADERLVDCKVRLVAAEALVVAHDSDRNAEIACAAAGVELAVEDVHVVLRAHAAALVRVACDVDSVESAAEAFAVAGDTHADAT